MNKTEYSIWQKHTHYVRSNILSQVAILEMEMKELLSIRFSNSIDDIKKFKRIFLETNRLPFNALIELYKQYLNEYEPEWMEKNKDFLQIVNELKELRNEFAHGINPMLDEVSEIEISNAPSIMLLLNKKGDVIIKKYSNQEITKLVGRIDKLIMHLHTQRKMIVGDKMDPAKFGQLLD